MEFLHSLLPNDFFIKFDYLTNYSNIRIIGFLNLLNDTLKIDNLKMKLRDILEILNPESKMEIESIYQNQNDFDIMEEIPFFLIHTNLNDLMYEGIFEKVKNFYFEYFNINSSKFDIFLKLEEEICLSSNRKLLSAILFYNNKKLNDLNNEIIDNIYNNFNKNVFKLEHNDKNAIEEGWKYINEKLYIFFKIVGKDFITLINLPINKDDPPSLKLAKFNSKYINQIRMSLYEKDNLDPVLYTGIKKSDSCVLLFLICFNFENNLNLIEIFSNFYFNKESLYKNRCIKLNKN
tara:strand:+ start:48 stop:920 length:873 start_codon:yes stop_codon:yes gene_type:complete